MILRVMLIISMLLSAASLGYLALQAFAPPAQAPVETAEAPLPPPPPTSSRIRMLVAARPLPAGTLLKDEDFVVREVLPSDVPEGNFPATADGRTEVRGALLRRYLDPNEPVLRGDVLRPRDRGFLAAVLRPGMRAVSIGVDQVTGTAGLIWPGDQVDLILSQELQEAPVSRRVTGETVLQDVRVIAVDQQISQGAGGSDAPVGRVARTVTLEVTPDQAERVVVAIALGRLVVAVRAMAPTEDAEGERAPTTFSSDVSPVLARTAVAPGQRMRVFQGGDERTVTFR